MLNIPRALFCLLVVTSVVKAADSGPSPDTAVTPFSSFALTGDVTNESVDFVARRGALPTLYCFIPGDRWGRPTARLLRKLDESVSAAANDGAIVAVWLTDDPASAREYLPKVQQSLQLTRTALTVYEANSSGPPEWGINTDVDVTIVAVREGRVRKSFALSSPNETLADEVLAALK